MRSDHGLDLFSANYIKERESFGQEKSSIIVYNLYTDMHHSIPVPAEIHAGWLLEDRTESADSFAILENAL